MNKADLASYLVSLHTLMEAQFKSQSAIPSTVLAEEYNRTWVQLKEVIKKEQEDASRQRE